MGRPKGQKNKPGHNAGRKRKQIESQAPITAWVSPHHQKIPKRTQTANEPIACSSSSMSTANDNQGNDDEVVSHNRAVNILINLFFFTILIIF